MRILVTVHGFLTPSMTFVYNQVLALESLGHSVKVVACKRINADLFPFKDVVVVEEGYGLSLIISKIINRLGVGYLLYSKTFTNGFKQIVDSFNPDLIHVHFGTQLVRVYPAVKNGNVPVITTFHGLDASKFLLNRNYVRTLKKIFESNLFWATTVAKDMRNRLIDYGVAKEDKFFTDYLGVDVDFFKPEVKETRVGRNFYYLQVSNFVEKKGHTYTIDAFARYLEKHADFESTLIFAGDGPLRLVCENQVEKLGIKDRVKFVGLVDKYGVRELMNKADCFVHHSITGKDGDKEGLPTVIMEALAMQLPVISTYHAGIPELIEHEKNGLLTEEKDIDALADMIYRIREIEPMDRRKLIIDDFNLEKNTLNIIKIFEKVICEFKKRSNQRC